METTKRRWRTAIVAVSAALFLGNGCLYNTDYARPRSESYGRYWSSHDSSGQGHAYGSARRSTSRSGSGDQSSEYRRRQYALSAVYCLFIFGLLGYAASGGFDGGGGSGDGFGGIEGAHY